RPGLRPCAMLACGRAMWIHGGSALNCGAMFFSAFFFLRAPGASLTRHVLNLLCCLVAFLAPVCVFLWPSLSQGAHFSGAELEVFREMQALRWREDFAGFWPRLGHAFAPGGALFGMTVAGLGCWVAVWFAGRRRHENTFGPLLRIIPAFLPGLAAVALLAWLEPLLAPDFGRLSMGHELVRGLRFLVPLSWLLIAAACACYLGKWQRRLLLVVVFCGLMLLNHDRQHVAAVSGLESLCGLPLSAQAEQLREEAEAERALLGRIAAIVPPNEAIFCPEDRMALRYVALRSVAHSFKDGYVFFYNKDLEKVRGWLAIEKALREGPGGLEKAWQLSGAPWLLVRRGDLERLPEALRERPPALENASWLLFHAP
ncbi:MAG: translation initiation factor 2, partial [Desulfovibrio sp.]|nr:translation initiation factor 2 [Desulfovibrio sp.]